MVLLEQDGAEPIGFVSICSQEVFLIDDSGS